MARVDEWFTDFMASCIGRIRRDDWPETDAQDGVEFWGSLKSALVRGGVDRDTAFESADVLAADPPRFLGDVIPAFRKTAKELLVARNVADKGLAPDSREAAMAAAEGCLDCGPTHCTGLTIRWRHRAPVGRESASVTLYCLCPMGRWVKARHLADRSAGLAGRIPDLADHPFLRRQPVHFSELPDNPHCYHPACWDVHEAQPIDVSRFRGDLDRASPSPRKLVASIAEGSAFRRPHLARTEHLAAIEAELAARRPAAVAAVPLPAPTTDDPTSEPERLTTGTPGAFLAVPAKSPSTDDDDFLS